MGNLKLSQKQKTQMIICANLQASGQFSWRKCQKSRLCFNTLNGKHMKTNRNWKKKKMRKGFLRLIEKERTPDGLNKNPHILLSEIRCKGVGSH